MGARPAASLTPLRSEAGNPTFFATTLWSHSARRLRAAWRGRLRRLRGAGLLALDLDWAAKLEISAREVKDIIQESAFGAAWRAIEDRSPLFARRMLRPAELPKQIAIARRWLPHLREGRSGARQHVQPKLTVSIPALDDAG